MNFSSTEDLAKKVRIHAVKMVNKGGSSHIGPILSIVDILAVLYGKVMNYKSNDPNWPKRDRFILSKGHAGAGVYATLAECGFFETSDLDQHYQDGSIFSGHVSHKGVPGVELSTGSLGHGLPVASGMALSAKLDEKNHKVFVVMGDGELDEGSNWEAFMFASHHNLTNLTVIIDRNRFQSIKTTEETLSLEPLIDKLEAFGWSVLEADGHNHNELFSAINNITDNPKVIIANTIKGKGVSFMENDIAWHYRTPSGDLFDQALNELGEKKMREAMMKTLLTLAEKDSNLMLLTADLGYGLFEEFEKKFPRQFFNIGVAEQNMMGVATGLALEGKIVFTYSIGNFPTLRCLEQIRNDACYHKLNINIVCSGGGFSYGGLGMSHHATEDLAIMRALPGITILAPSTSIEAEFATKQLSTSDGVGYLRIDKSKFINSESIENVSIGDANVLREGNDITLIAAGGIASEAMKAADELSKFEIECRVLSLYSIKPIDIHAIESACEQTNGIITIEEGNLAGGVGSAVSEVCLDNGFNPIVFKRFGLDDQYSSIVGSQDYLRSVYEIDSSKIIDFILNQSNKWKN